MSLLFHIIEMGCPISNDTMLCRFFPGVPVKSRQGATVSKAMLRRCYAGTPLFVRCYYASISQVLYLWTGGIPLVLHGWFTDSSLISYQCYVGVLPVLWRFFRPLPWRYARAPLVFYWFTTGISPVHPVVKLALHWYFTSASLVFKGYCIPALPVIQWCSACPRPPINLCNVQSVLSWCSTNLMPFLLR